MRSSNGGGGVCAGDVAGCLDANGYRVIKVGGKKYYAHRLAWFLTHGVWPSHQIDHINGNPSDNRLRNLRIATQSENNRNCGANKKNTTGYKGVTFHKRDGRYQSQIRINGDRIYLGYFLTAEEAYASYCEAAGKHHGKFARLT